MSEMNNGNGASGVTVASDSQTQPQGGADASSAEGTESNLEIYSNSREEVKKLLQQRVKEESGEALDDGAEPASKKQEPGTNESGVQQSKTPQKDATAQPPAKAEVKGSSGQSATASPNNGQVSSAQQGAAIDDKEQKQKNKALFIEKRNSELANLKSQISTQKSQIENRILQLKEGLDQRYHETPSVAMEDHREIERLSEQLSRLDTAEQEAQRIVESQTIFVLQNEDVTLDDLAGVLEADGTPANIIAEFKKNPWTYMDPVALTMLGKRANAEKQYKQADEDRRVLAQYVRHLEGEVETLKKKPNQVVSRLQEELSRPQQVTASFGRGASNDSSAVTINPALMTPQEIKAKLQERRRAEGNIG